VTRILYAFDMDKKELEILESEYQEILFKESRDRRHWRYINIGAIIGFLFVLISTSFESEFYKVFGTLGMGILNSAAGLCFLMAFISFLPGVRAERNSKWNDLEIKRKELEKLRKEVRK
jgi:hypothetical protein